MYMSTISNYSLLNRVSLLSTAGGRGGVDPGRAARHGTASAAADRHTAPAALRQGAAATISEATGGPPAPGKFILYNLCLLLRTRE